jgi:hypothetical protein
VSSRHRPRGWLSVDFSQWGHRRRSRSSAVMPARRHAGGTQSHRLNPKPDVCRFDTLKSFCCGSNKKTRLTQFDLNLRLPSLVPTVEVRFVGFKASAHCVESTQASRSAKRVAHGVAEANSASFSNDALFYPALEASQSQDWTSRVTCVESIYVTLGLPTVRPSATQIRPPSLF